VSRSVNNRNRAKSSNCSSKFIGVGWYKSTNKWKAYTKANNISEHIGYFDDELEAAKAVETRMRERDGDYMRVNFADEEMIVIKARSNETLGKKYEYTPDMLENLDNMRWCILYDYPMYTIYSNGVIRNDETKNFICGTIDIENYRYVHIYHNSGVKKVKKVHILLAECFIPNPNNYPIVDHIDGNRSNNNLDNLRWVTYGQNAINKAKSNNTSSKYKGVSRRHNGTWECRIKHEGKSTFIGTFKDEREAAISYIKKAKELQGEFYRKLDYEDELFRDNLYKK